MNTSQVGSDYAQPLKNQHLNHVASAPVGAEEAGVHVTVAIPDHIAAGVPFLLTYRLESLDHGEPLTDIAISHEMYLHLVVVRSDLSTFAHLHPAAGEPGEFSVEMSFPLAGTYHAFTEFEREGGQKVLLEHEFSVEGRAVEIQRLEPSNGSRTACGYVVSLETSIPPQVGRPVSLVMDVRKESTGDAASDLKPYLGAAAHLIIVRYGSLHFSHSHGEPQRSTEGRTGLLGPRIGFEHVFQLPGTYRLWAQFNGGDGVTRTVSWTLRVDEATAREALPDPHVHHQHALT